MRRISRISLVVAASAALVGSMALPASAADTTATVEVEAGTIAISAPANAPLSAVTPGGTATASILDVQVVDNRADVQGWSASVTLTAFTGGTTATVIPASAASYTPAAAEETGTSTVTAAGEQNLSAARTVQTATLVNGNNTATWDATLEVVAPSDALADVYTATLTHSVL